MIKRIGCSRATFLRWRNAKRFPEPTRLSSRFIGWNRKTVTRWLIEHGMQDLDPED